MVERPGIGDVKPIPSSLAKPGFARTKIQKCHTPSICNWRLSVFLCVLFLSLLIFVQAEAQVALDASTSAAALLTTATNTVTLAHPSTRSNLVLGVGISMDIFRGSTATVSGVTYNSVSLTRAGFHNDSANQRRTEMWYLIAPATGNNNIVVTVNVPAAATIGTVVGATTFTGADQTSPIRTYASNDENTNAPHVDVASGTNDIVL